MTIIKQTLLIFSDTFLTINNIPVTYVLMCLKTICTYLYNYSSVYLLSLKSYWGLVILRESLLMDINVFTFSIVFENVFYEDTYRLYAGCVHNCSYNVKLVVASYKVASCK